MTRRRTPTAEELRLWRFVIRDAEPMPGRAVEDPDIVAAVPPSPEPVATSPVPPPTARPSSGPARPGRPTLPPLTPGSIANIDRRTGDRFRRGHLAIDGRIDLHGMTQAQAHGALAAFVHRSWSEGKRCILVITGKGTFTGGPGVLRQAVPGWLADARLRPMVLAIQPAQPRDGGDGALYVLIKRRRDRRE